MGKNGARTPRSRDTMQTPRSGADGSVNEQRIDPADGNRLTWEVLYQKYAKKYSVFQIRHYWYNECALTTPRQHIPEAASKGNVKTPKRQRPRQEDAAKATADQEAAAKAKAEQEAAAKAKAEQEAAIKAKSEQEAAAKAKAEQEAAIKAKAEQEAAARAKAEQEAAAKVKAEQEAAAKVKEEQEVAAKVKAEQEAVAKAKAEQEAAAKAKAEQEAAAKVKAEEEAADKAKYDEVAAKEKAEREHAAKAAVKAAQAQGMLFNLQEDSQAREPSWAAFMVWLGDLTNKFCKGSGRGTHTKKSIGGEPQLQMPEQLVGA